MTFENQTVTAWQHIFELCSVIMIICGIIYLIFNDGSLQKWNKPQKELLEVGEIKKFISNNNIMSEVNKQDEVKEK